jgi:hypothetical protein
MNLSKVAQANEAIMNLSKVAQANVANSLAANSLKADFLLLHNVFLEQKKIEVSKRVNDMSLKGFEGCTYIMFASFDLHECDVVDKFEDWLKKEGITINNREDVSDYDIVYQFGW